MRDDTTLVEDAAAALHVALHRAEALARLAAARGLLLGETSVALAALATFEGSYTYGDQQTIQATSAAGQVSTGATGPLSVPSCSLPAWLVREPVALHANMHSSCDAPGPFHNLLMYPSCACRHASLSAHSVPQQQCHLAAPCSRCGTTTVSRPTCWLRCTRESGSC